MNKINLPVILLRGMILLPHNELKLEFDNDASKSIIDTASMFHNNRLLIVSTIDPLEQTPKLDSLPKFGVVAKIKQKMELPNGTTRIVLMATSRATVDEYLNLKSLESLESIVEVIKEENPLEEDILIKKLTREIQNFVKMIPYASNSILNKITGIKTLSALTDLTTTILPINFQRLSSYLSEVKPEIRMDMMLEDIYKEKEMFYIDKKIDSKVQSNLDKTQKDYLLRERIKAIKTELGDEDDNLELGNRIQNLDAPEKIIKRLKKELSKYETVSPNSPEVNISLNYINWLLDLPWNILTEDNKDLKSVKELLDETHYGLVDVKQRIIEFLAVKQRTNSLKAPILCLVGPPGVGKTSLASSIAKAVDRNFVKMSVGGVNDESEIVGHRKTYVGASPGRIIQSMKKAKSKNPVFLIDEIDKMTKDFKGDPASTLLEILDPEQNSYFSDNYIEEEFDLSEVLFVATANSLASIPEPLRDRLEIVMLSGYTDFEKLDIAKKHLIPKILKNHELSASNFKISNKYINKVIRNYTKEAGVRELERQLSKIVRKIVTEIVMSGKEVQVKVDDAILEKYLGLPIYNDFDKSESKVGVVNGLAYTNYGGDTLPIEVNYFKGKGKLILTGSLGEVMKESAYIALSYVKANAEYFKIDQETLENSDIHIHVPEGAIKKDGPSAGIALTSALISAFRGELIDNRLAMTGEITLRGNVLPIGGLKEKSIGALRNGIKTIIIPKDNLNSLVEVPDEVKNKINYITVSDYKSVYDYIIK